MRASPFLSQIALSGTCIASRARHSCARALRLFLTHGRTSPGFQVDRLEPRELLVAYAQGSDPNITGGNPDVPFLLVDVDNDNDLDQVLGSSDTNQGGSPLAVLRVFINNGLGSLIQTQTLTAPGAIIGTFPARTLALDANNDGNIDILTPGPYIWLGNGNGTFQGGQLVTPAINARDIRVLRANNDNFPDLVFIESTGELTIATGVGNGTFSLGTSIPIGSSLTTRLWGTGNTDGDTDDDILVWDQDQDRLLLVRNDGNDLIIADTRSSFNPRLGTGSNLSDYDSGKPLTADINADGRPDVVFAGGTQGLLAIFTEPGNRLSSIRRLREGNVLGVIGLGDFNRDSRPDIFVGVQIPAQPGGGGGTPAQDRILAWAGSGQGNFDGEEAFVRGGQAGTLPTGFWGVGDVTGDQRADVLFVSGPAGSGSRLKWTTSSGPAITTLQLPTTPIIPGTSVTITAQGVTFAPSTSGPVRLYFDSNANGRYDIADRLLATSATTGADRPITFVMPDGLPSGSVRFFAIAAATFPAEGISDVRAGLATVWTRVMYPEGFRTLGNVNEHVPIVNDNDVPVNYRIILRYETGERDLIFEEGVIGPNSRGGITTTLRSMALGDSPVRTGVGYAFEVQSSLPLGAQLARYDTFGVPQAGPGTGESFTNRVAREWAIAEMRKTFFDFILLYNPYPTTVNVSITFTDSNGTDTVITRAIEAYRRSGVAVQEQDLLNNAQTYGVRISSSGAIVAAHSRYRPGTGRGFTSLAQPLELDGQPTSGSNYVIPDVDLENGGTPAAEFFNPSATAATVQLIGTYEGSAQTTTRSFTLSGRQRTRVSLNTGAPNGATRATFRVISPVVLAVSLEVVDPVKFDSNATVVAPFAAQKWAFADGFLGKSSLGNLYQEYVTLFNPNSEDITVRFKFLFENEEIVANYTVAAGRTRVVALHSVPELIARPVINWFSTVVDSSSPFTASLTHWDLTQPGGWTTLGVALDSVVPIPVPV